MVGSQGSTWVNLSSEQGHNDNIEIIEIIDTFLPNFMVENECVNLFDGYQLAF